MAERSFEERAEELREARDVYMEGEEGGLEGVGIVPGVPGARPVRGRRVEDEVKDQRDLLKGLRAEIQELRKVVSVLRGGFVEVSEAFAGFRKEFIQVGKEFQVFHGGFSQFVKDFGQFAVDFKRFQEEFSQVSKKLRDEFGKLFEWVGSLGKVSKRLEREYRASVGKVLKVSYELKKEYEKLTLEDVIRGARVRRRSGAGGEGRYEGRGKGYRLGGLFKYPSGIVLQERPRYGLGFVFGVGYKKGKGYRYGRDDEEYVFSIRDWFRRMPVRLVFGEGGGWGRGRYGGGGVLGEMRNVLFSLMGPIGVHVMEWAEGLYERWEYWKEKKKALEEERRAELEVLGIRKVREVERGRKGWFSEVSQFVAELLGFVGGRGRGGVVLSAVGVSGGGLFSVGRRVSKVSLSDVELVQERSAKIYADKLHIEAKQVSGVGGGGGLLDMLPGGGLFRRVGRLGRWAGRLGLGVGIGLAFLSGVQEGGLGRGIFRGLGALGGGLGGAKLGALIGTAIAPGVGTAIGGVLGGVLGMLGGEKIADAVYSGMKRLIKDRDWVESLRSGFESVVSRIGSFLKSIVEGVKSGVSVIGSGVREFGEKVLDVARWLGESLGVVARVAEAGTIDMVKAAGVVSKTKGDIGGMSAGMYQFTKEPQLKFLREYGFMKEFEGVQFGTVEWKRKWEEVARKYGEEFAKAQQEFAVKEYFMPGVRVAERFGIDVGRSRALQEMVFARSIQHGVRGFRNVLRNVFGGMTPEQVRAMSPEEIITRVYDHLIANVDRYWASSAPRVRESVRKRLIREKELLLAMERQKKEVKEQVGLQGKMTKEVKELRGSVKEQAKVYKSAKKKSKDAISGKALFEEGRKSLPVEELEVHLREYERQAKEHELAIEELKLSLKYASDPEVAQEISKEIERLQVGVRMYKENADKTRKLLEEKYKSMSIEELEAIARRYEEKARKSEEDVEELSKIGIRSIEGQRELSRQIELAKAEAEMYRKEASKVRKIIEEKRRQQGLADSFVGYEPGEKIYAPSGVFRDEGVVDSFVDYEPGEKIYAPSSVFKDEGVVEGSVVDDVIVADQQRVVRQVIEEGVKTSAEMLNSIVQAIEGAKGRERAGGSVGKVNIPGGDAFSRVPLFPEDVGLVLMMMGLV